MKRAIEPHLALDDMITGWNDISKFLAERHRCRNSQLLSISNIECAIKQLSAYGVCCKVETDCSAFLHIPLSPLFRGESQKIEILNIKS